MFFPKSLKRVLKACLDEEYYSVGPCEIAEMRSNGIVVTEHCKLNGHNGTFHEECKIAPALHALEVGDYSSVDLHNSIFNCFIKVGEFSKVTYESRFSSLFLRGPLFAVSGKQCCDIKVNIDGKYDDPDWEWAKGFAVKGNSFDFNLYFGYSEHYYALHRGAWYLSLSGEAKVGNLQLMYNCELLCEIPPNKYFSFSGTSLEDIKKDVRKWQRERKRTEASYGTEPRSVCA